jgi:hypothetical protein
MRENFTYGSVRALKVKEEITYPSDEYRGHIVRERKLDLH